MRRIMHVDLDTFFVAVERVGHPELCGKPVIVGGASVRGVVSTASYEARAFGVRSGMPLATARRLCPQAVFVTGHYRRYVEASAQFMGVLADFSPFLEPAGLDEAYLEATGFESLYGSAGEMARRIKARVRAEIGIVASIGIAGVKVAAKVASANSKPDGLIEVPPGGEAAFLAPFPIRELPGVGAKTEPLLRARGLTTIGALARVPEAALQGLLGSHGVYLGRLARGLDESPVLPPAEAKSISHETTFATDTRRHAHLTATLRYLAERVGRRLREQGKVASCVALKLRYGDFTTITRQCHLPEPVETDEAIFTAGRALLERALAQDGRAVRLLGIGVAQLGTGRQLNLLDAGSERATNLNRAVDRIRTRYGFGAIQTGRTLTLAGDS